SLIMLPLAIVIDRPWTVVTTVGDAGAVAGLVLFSTVVAYILYFGLLRSAGASNLLLATLLVPFSAHILGSVFMAEPLYVSSVLGMACIVLGLSIIDGRLMARLRRVRAAGEGRT
ncbi:EamA family transporter, partial [Chloroflexota bacterium]